MSSYVTLNLRVDLFDEILNALRSYSSNLNNYYEIEDTVHLIDHLYDEYFKSKEEEDRELKEWQEYEELFLEVFENEDFRDENGNINNRGIYRYKNFNKVNNVLKDYKEGGCLDILDSKQQFFLVLSILDVLEEKQ